MKETMKQAIRIARREFGSYFTTPVALVFLIAFLLLSVSSMYFWGSFFVANEASMRSYFYWLPFIFSAFVPAVGMRMWCEERRQHTMEILLTFPVSIFSAVFGKYIAGLLFMVLGLLLTFPMVVTVFVLGNPDIGPVVTGYLGAVLLSGMMLSICSLLSAVTSNQVVCYVVSAVVNLLLVLCGHQSTLQFVRAWFGKYGGEMVSWFGISGRYEMFQRGVIDCGDCVCLLSVTALFLWLTCRGLEATRGN